MTKEQYTNELNYRIAIHISNRMLDEGLITKQELDKISELMIKKYNPIISSL